MARARDVRSSARRAVMTRPRRAAISRLLSVTCGCFAVYGTSVYPDATFSLRLSFGAIAGWSERGVDVNPVTVIGGAFERHTGAFPFELPTSWLKAQKSLDPTTPMNFATTNDIIGGNSGSPVVNKDGEVVGLSG